MASNGKKVEVPSSLTVRELATLINVSPIDVIKELMNNGIMANINQVLDYDTAAIVVQEMGFEAQELRSGRAGESPRAQARPRSGSGCTLTKTRPSSSRARPSSR